MSLFEFSEHSGHLTIRPPRNFFDNLPSISGEVDGDLSSSFQDAMSKLQNKTISAVVLDMAEVSYVSSAGLAWIIELRNVFRCHDRELLFCLEGIGEGLMHVLAKCALDRLFFIKRQTVSR